jgi:hypothetical protein
MFRGQIWLLLALSLGSGACTGAPTGHTPSGSRPSASAAVVVSADPQRCARLAKKGFTPCPPTPDRLQLPPTTIKNATNGAISDTTAQEWGRAFQLTEAYYRWAMQNGGRSALTSGVLADPTLQAVGNLFGSDLKDLDAAKEAGGILTYQPPPIPVTQLVSLPPDTQTLMRNQGLTPSSYGLAVRFTGPTRRAIRFPDGHETEIFASDSQAPVDVVIWGELRTDSDLGPIWFEHGFYGCTGELRAVCQM